MVNHYNNWLINTNLHSVIGLDTTSQTLQIFEGRLKLNLTTPNLESYLLSRNWLDSIAGISLPEVLLSKMSFVMNAERPQISISIKAIDGLIILSYDDGRVVEDVFENLGEAEDTITVKLQEVRGLVFDGATTKKRLSKVKRRLTSEIESYFKQFESRSWFSKYDFDDGGSKHDHELILEIKNVVNIITSEDFYEFIRIEFKFEEINEELKITYRIHCQYAAGLLWSPDVSRYRDVDTLVGENRFNVFTSKFYRFVSDTVNEI